MRTDLANIWPTINEIAPVVYAARLFGVSSPEQGAAIMLKGHELGFGLTASFEFIHVINGRPGLSPRGALALILQSDVCAGIEISDNDDHCVVTMQRTNGFTYTTSFSMDDARRAALVKPDSGWTKYPANMLRWRAVGYCADVVFPDVIGGMKRIDELGADITPEGDLARPSPYQITTPPPAPSPPPPAAPTLDDLLATYSAEQILAVNHGQIPATSADITRVKAALDAAGDHDA
jgi:hypothetical protein